MVLAKLADASMATQIAVNERRTKTLADFTVGSPVLLKF
jgi:hypothetical protein